MHYSLPGSSVHRILQARILERVATSCSRRSSQSRCQTHVSQVSCIGKWVLLTLVPPGKPPVISEHLSILFIKDFCISLIQKTLLIPTMIHCKSEIKEQKFLAVQSQPCPTLCDPMDYSRPSFPVLHNLLECAQAQVH